MRSSSSAAQHRQQLPAAPRAVSSGIAQTGALLFWHLLALHLLSSRTAAVAAASAAAASEATVNSAAAGAVGATAATPHAASRFGPGGLLPGRADKVESIRWIELDNDHVSSTSRGRSLSARGAAHTGGGQDATGGDDYGTDDGGGGDYDDEGKGGSEAAAAAASSPRVLPTAAPIVVLGTSGSAGPASSAAAGVQTTQRRQRPQQPSATSAAAAPASAPGASAVAAAGRHTGSSGGGGSARGGGGSTGGGAGGGVSWSSRHAGGDHAVPEGTVSKEGCEAPPRPLPRRLLEEWQCKEFSKMCVDQQQFVSYDPKYYGPGADPLPGFDVHEILYNYPNPYGNGDKFKAGTALRAAPVELRRAVPAEEACPDLRRPVFSACTHPLVLWQKYMFNVGETFESTIVGLYEAATMAAANGTGGTGGSSSSSSSSTYSSINSNSGAAAASAGTGGLGLDPALSLVVATPHGLRLPAYWQLLAGPFFRRQVVSLADFSARLHARQEAGAGAGEGAASSSPAAASPPPLRSNATAEGVHVRCFERLTMCRVVKRKRERTTAAGAHLLRHYGDRLPSVSDLFDVEGEDRDTLKVVIASRPNATGRAILNEQELLDSCNGLDPGEAYRAGVMAAGGLAQSGSSSGSSSSSSSSSRNSSSSSGGLRPGAGRVFRRLKCVPHVFGRNPLYDLSLAKSLDVLVATHGAAGYHSFYMSRGASLVEVLPLGFSARWANVYYARMLELDKKVFYWAIYIRNASNSENSELQQWPTFRKAMRARERHVRLPWAAFKHHLTAILQVGGDPGPYKAAYAAGRHVISDGLKLLPHRPRVNDSGWVNYTAGEAVRPARLRLA